MPCFVPGAGDAEAPSREARSYVNREVWRDGVDSYSRALSAVVAQPGPLIPSGVKGAFLEEVTFALEG